jgi:phosphatidate cytidylyltransferase
MLRWRLLLGTLLIAGLAGLCWLDFRSREPGIWLMPVLVLITLLATREVLDLLRPAGMKPAAWSVYAGNLLLAVGVYVLAFFDRSHGASNLSNQLFYPLYFLEPLWGLTLAVVLISVAEICRYEKPGGSLANIAGGVFALVYVGVMLSMAVGLRTFCGIWALAAWIIAVKMGDIGAYTSGRLFGRHKLAPRISPGKTIEGALGAMVMACLGAWASFTWLPPPQALLAVRGAPLDWLPFGLLMGATGILGDLVESLLKREAGCKDSSTWLPGFGGVLDILDSLLLSIPFAWLFMLVRYAYG